MDRQPYDGGVGAGVNCAHMRRVLNSRQTHLWWVRQLTGSLDCSRWCRVESGPKMYETPVEALPEGL